MESYGQFCPVAKTAEIISERWMPLILRELMCGSRRFSEIHRRVPLISPALLSKRLRQLERAGVVTLVRNGRGHDCMLTEAGWELYPIIQAMDTWGQRWARSSDGPDELDPGLLMWDVRRMLAPLDAGSERLVIEFRFRSASAGRSSYWLEVDATSVDLCLVDPGHPVDLVVRAELRALTEVWMGDCTLQDAIAAGAIELDGPRALVRRFPTWFGTHPILGGIERAGAARVCGEGTASHRVFVPLAPHLPAASNSWPPCPAAISGGRGSTRWGVGERGGACEPGEGARGDSEELCGLCVAVVVSVNEQHGDP